MKILLREAVKNSKTLYNHILEASAKFEISRELDFDMEDADVTFEVTDDGMTVENVNKDAAFVLDELDTKADYIKFNKVDVSQCQFSDYSQGDDGVIKFTVEFEADAKITDANDLRFIAQLFLDDFNDRAEGRVEGNIVYSVDDFNPFSDYGHSEHIETGDVNEPIDFIYDEKSVNAELVSVTAQ